MSSWSWVDTLKPCAGTIDSHRFTIEKEKKRKMRKNSFIKRAVGRIGLLGLTVTVFVYICIIVRRDVLFLDDDVF